MLWKNLSNCGETGRALASESGGVNYNFKSYEPKDPEQTPIVLEPWYSFQDIKTGEGIFMTNS